MIDIDELRRIARIEDVLAMRGLAPNGRGMLSCPLPGHEDSTPSFHVIDDERFYCFGCLETGSVFDLAIALGLARNFADACDVLAAHYRLDARAGPFTRRASIFVPKRLRPSLPPLPVLTPEKRQRLDAYVADAYDLFGTPGARYIGRRGIDPAIAATHGVRFAPNWQPYEDKDPSAYRPAWQEEPRPALLFEVFDENATRVAAQGRYLSATADPKAMTFGVLGLGVFATKGAFAAPGVAIVEAPIDAITFALHNLPAIALCGTGASAQRKMLRLRLAGKRVVLATDSDRAGDIAADELRAALNCGTHCTRLCFADAKDANEALLRDRDRFAAIVAAATAGTQ